MKPSEKFQRWTLTILMIIVAGWGVFEVVTQIRDGNFTWSGSLVPFMLVFSIWINLMVFQHRTGEDERWRRILERSMYYSFVIFIGFMALLMLVLMSVPVGWSNLETVFLIFIFFGLTNSVITVILTKRM